MVMNDEIPGQGLDRMMPAMVMPDDGHGDCTLISTPTMVTISVDPTTDATI
ncbi:hypothetical protein [Streptomyces sp. NPDC015130]|uniref:hypothetical protein n=1 Tax=Streptomyces sp. NPDC015130 TaxID=3364940 RepID=UPI0036FD7E70